MYEDWLVENRDVYKAEDLEDFEQKIRKILCKEVPDLTEAGYQVVKERSIEKVGARLEDIYTSAYAETHRYRVSRTEKECVI